MDQDYNPQCSDCLCCSHATLHVNNNSPCISQTSSSILVTHTPKNQDSNSVVLYRAKSQQETQPNTILRSISSLSCLPRELDDLSYRLMEIEEAMLGPNSDEGADNKWREMMEIVARGNLKETLMACARAVSDGDLLLVNWLMTEVAKMVSVHGEPLQRLGAYMLEGLVARHASSGSSIYKSLRCKEPPPGSDLLSYMRIIYELCPYIKFAYLSANTTILETMSGENNVHIIDFQIAQGTQWIGLIQALGTQPGWHPCLRITGIDDPASAYARGGDLSIVAARLSKIAESVKVPFEFHAVEVTASDIEIRHFDMRRGEAVAVNFILKLHHIPDESVDVTNHRDRILRMVKSVSPKVVTITEQESNTNTAPFYQRFGETLDYYNAMFESIDVTLPRENKERTKVEQHCLAKEIVNIIACEGAEREERHELFGKWKSRLTMAGFNPCPSNPTIHASVSSLLLNYDNNYTCHKRGDALYLGWRNRDLLVFSAWR